jgi:transcription elongation GreA/GreB family factor
MQIPRRQWSRRPPPNTEPVYLTPEGVKRLEARLARLKSSLPAVIEEAARTAAYGDRSDNAEYKEAKGILRRTRGQILNIEDQLKRLVMIPAGADASGKIRLGSTVVLEIKKGGDVVSRKTFRIVGSSETDPARGRISHTSPLGAALIGHVEDDIVMIQTPGGQQEYLIVKVS